MFYLLVNLQVASQSLHLASFLSDSPPPLDSVVTEEQHQDRVGHDCCLLEFSLRMTAVCRWLWGLAVVSTHLTWQDEPTKGMGLSPGRASLGGTTLVLGQYADVADSVG